MNRGGALANAADATRDAALVCREAHAKAKRQPVPLLAVNDLRVVFEGRGGCVCAVDGLSYQLHAGKTLAITGETGSGKSVGCRALVGLLPATATVTGSVRLDGKQLLGLKAAEIRKHRGADIALVFQNAADALNPTMRIGDQIVEAVRAHEAIGRRGARMHGLELLRQLGFAAPQQRFSSYAHQLSGGMQQRVMLAIALAGSPRVLVADEMTRSLDPITRAQIMELLVNLQHQLGTALILIDHDLELAASFADDVLVMYAGRPVEYAPAAELFARPRMPYTRALLDAIPRSRAATHTLALTSVRCPDVAHTPTGCMFEPRCPRSGLGCASASPPFVEHELGHHWACWHPCAG